MSPLETSAAQAHEAHHLGLRAHHALAGAPQQIESQDLDDASRQLSSLYNSNRLSQSDRSGRFRMNLRSTQLGQLGLATLSFGAPVQLEQSGDRPFVLVSTQVQGHCRVSTSRASAEGQRGFVVVDSAGEAVSKQFSADSLRCHVRIAQSLLEAQCTALLQRPLHQPLRFAPFGCNQGTAQQRWFGLLHLLLSHTGSPLPALLLRPLEEAVLLHLLLEHQHTHSAALLPQPPAVAPRHVKRAEDYLRTHASQPLTLADIAQAAGCSVRSLNEGFRQFRQTTPMGFLKQLRLQSVRAELTHNLDGASVSDIALRWGFGHLSRFASDYRQQFGELPSETLRRH